MSTRLYGPDGGPLVVQKGTALARVTDRKAYEQATVVLPGQVDGAIAKQVRSQGVTLGSSWDKARGRPKPTPVTFDTLRLIGSRNEWVRAIVKRRGNQLGGKSWSIQVRDGDDPTGAAAKAARSITKLLKHPSLHGSSPSSRPWRTFLGMWIRDVLELDRGCIEKERDGRGWIIALYPVDGATIRPNLDDRGGYLDDSYVQVVDGQITARFGMEELICTMDNEQTDVRYAGYGLSPLESLIISVTADLHAAKFNASYFEKGAVPEGILDLGEDAAPEDVDAFRLYWANEVQGRPWSFPVLGGAKAPQWLQWRDSNRDMQFMEYQQWLLQKICAVFQFAPKDLGQIDDVNRSTAEDASEQSDEAGLDPLKQLVKDTIDLEIIGEHGQGLGDYLEFVWDEQGESADAINQKFQPMHEAGVATGGEWRDAQGLDPDGDPDATHGKDGLKAHLQNGDRKPLPSQRDMDVQGAAAVQDREDAHKDAEYAREDAKEANEPGEAASVPWAPADPDHPDTKAAMAAHDDEQGIGPRNVSKTAPGGHDRNPALTHRTDSLDDVFARAGDELVDGLTKLLGEIAP